MSTRTGKPLSAEGTITIRLTDGVQLVGNFTLTETGTRSAEVTRVLDASKSTPAGAPATDLDFSIPVRPFMNDHSDGLSGSKKFALLVAHFAKGEVDAPVDRGEVVDAWNKMTGLLGGRFNTAHESRAKDAGYIYVPNPGKLALLKKWRQAVS